MNGAEHALGSMTSTIVHIDFARQADFVAKCLTHPRSHAAFGERIAPDAAHLAGRTRRRFRPVPSDNLR